MAGSSGSWARRGLIGAGAVAALVVVGPFVYINFIASDAPPPLTLDSSTPGTGATGSTVARISGAPLTSLEGAWTVTTGSQAGYRVVEVLFGQDSVAVGRTTTVAGSATVSGNTVSAATLTVDLTTVQSDDNRRDNQFRGRIMNTAQFPTATFTLAQPLPLAGLPEEGVDTEVTAAGNLTLRGQTRAVEADLTLRRSGDTISVAGAIAVRFADYGIPDPSLPGITTRDNGLLEFVLHFAKA